jgi:hypothetical protein
MKQELLTVESLVEETLKESKAARNSDMFLYVKICEKINPEVLNLPIYQLLLSLKEYGIPCPESVRRTRQKLQAANIELASDKRIAKLREKNEEEFREYARS